MAKRHAFWVILAGSTPTSFRSRDRDTLVPTLRQLQRTQPDVVLRWFERGQMWDSPLAARDALKARRQAGRPREAGWRPGGAHRDPRERFKRTRDQKRAAWKRRHRGPAEGGGLPGPEGQPPRAQGKQKKAPFGAGGAGARKGGGAPGRGPRRGPGTGWRRDERRPGAGPPRGRRGPGRGRSRG